MSDTDKELLADLADELEIAGDRVKAWVRSLMSQCDAYRDELAALKAEKLEVFAIGYVIHDDDPVIETPILVHGSEKEAWIRRSEQFGDCSKITLEAAGYRAIPVSIVRRKA